MKKPAWLPFPNKIKHDFLYINLSSYLSLLKTYQEQRGTKEKITGAVFAGDGMAVFDFVCS